MKICVINTLPIEALRNEHSKLIRRLHKTHRKQKDRRRDLEITLAYIQRAMQDFEQ